MAEKNVQWKKELASIPGRLANNDLNHVAGWRARVVAAATREAKLLSSASADFNSDSSGYCGVASGGRLSFAESKTLTNVAQLNVSIKRLNDNMAFHEVSEKSLKYEHETART